jgi:hypothetical protein
MPHREPLADLTFRPLKVEVQAETTPHTTYTVTLPHCPCPDFQFRDGVDGAEPHLCKHILGVYAAMHGWRTSIGPTRPASGAADSAASETLLDLMEQAKTTLEQAKTALGQLPASSLEWLRRALDELLAAPRP